MEIRYTDILERETNLPLYSQINSRHIGKVQVWYVNIYMNYLHKLFM